MTGSLPRHLYRSADNTIPDDVVVALVLHLRADFHVARLDASVVRSRLGNFEPVTNTAPPKDHIPLRRRCAFNLAATDGPLFSFADIMSYACLRAECAPREQPQ